MMLFNETVNLFVGLALTFAAVALLVSSVTEALASVLEWRSRTLLDGIQRLLNDQDLNGLALAVMNHVAANPLAQGNANAPPLPLWRSVWRRVAGPGWWAWATHLLRRQPVPGAVAADTPTTAAVPLAVLPSYIDPQQFASALIDTVKTLPTAQGTAGLRAAIAAMPHDTLPEQQIRDFLLHHYDELQGNVEDLKKRLAAWFDASMDRLSGEYKRRTQLWHFCLGLALAALINVDAIAISQRLWAHPDIMSSIKAPFDDPQKAYDVWAKSIPYGWPVCRGEANCHTVWPFVFLGWICTAFATLFGAPFWFDTLQRFVNVRGTGDVPGAPKPT